MLGVKLHICCKVVPQSAELIPHNLCPRKDQTEFKYFYKTKKLWVMCLSGFRRMPSEMADILSWKSQMETSSQHSATARMKWK